MVIIIFSHCYSSSHFLLRFHGRSICTIEGQDLADMLKKKKVNTNKAALLCLVKGFRSFLFVLFSFFLVDCHFFSVKYILPYMCISEVALSY